MPDEKIIPEKIIPIAELGEVLVREERAMTPDERRRLDEHLGRKPPRKHAIRSTGGKFVKKQPPPEQSRVLPGKTPHEA